MAGGGSLLRVGADLIVLSDDASGARVFDVRRPREPRLAGSIGTTGTGLAAWRDLLLQAGTAGLNAYRFDETGTPTLAWARPDLVRTGAPGSPVVAGDRLVVPSDHGLAVLDLVRGPTPELLGIHTAGPPDAFAVTTIGPLVAVGGEGTLTLLDVEDPAHPRIVSQLGNFGRVTSLVERDGLLFVAQRQLDIGSLVSTGPGGSVVDVRTPETPKRVRDESNLTLLAVTSDGGAYGSSGDSRVVTLDLARAASPSGPSAAGQPGALTALAAAGGFVAASGDIWRRFDVGLFTDAPGLQVFDVRDPLTMTAWPPSGTTSWYSTARRCPSWT